VLRTTEFRNACITVTLMSAVFFVTVLYGPQFMEKILGFSALKAGVGMLPMLGMFAVTSFIAGPLYGRLGPKITITAGAVGLTVGPFLLSMVDAGASYSSLIVGFALTGLGAGLFYPSVTTAGVTALDPSRTSLAGGLVYMCQIAGGAIGVAITTTIFTITSENDLDSKATAAHQQLTDHQVAVLHGQLAGTKAAAHALHELPQSAQNVIVPIIKDSFAVGVQAGFRFVSIAAVLGLLISLFFVGGRLLPQRTAAAERAGA
jgi:MFS family permease